jgi:uncharacterized membrane protein YvlD (DUF360 family)
LVAARVEVLGVLLLVTQVVRAVVLVMVQQAVELQLQDKEMLAVVKAAQAVAVAEAVLEVLVATAAEVQQPVVELEQIQ